MGQECTNLDKAPFPWFGGKSQAAPLVWRLLGDVAHYVEPFFGSGAVLLNRPHLANRRNHDETINDLDGFVVNFWRAVQLFPQETAIAASWPVTECDKNARQIALLRWRENGARERLAGDAMWCDPVMAGWWAWAVSVQIGAFHARGGWTADPMTGCIRKTGSQNGPRMREPGVLDPPPVDASDLCKLDCGWEYHDLVMPELIRWFRHLAARLRHVVIINGDWSRVVTIGAAWNLPVRMGHGPCGVFLDPPYADTAGRDERIYVVESTSVAHDVREWCLRWGDNPKFRIVLAGFEGEHGDALRDAGWTEHEWFKDGLLRGGMANIGRRDDHAGHQQHRERLWASPHCLPVDAPTLFDPMEMRAD